MGGGGEALVLEAESGIVMDQGLLAGEDAARPALGLGIGQNPFHHLAGPPLPPVLGQGVYAEDHLPGSRLPVKGGVGIHGIQQMGFVGDQTV